MTKTQWKLKKAAEIFRNKINLENAIRIDLKNYFAGVKALIAKGDGNGFHSVKGVIQKHNVRIIDKILKVKRKSVDFIKLETMLINANHIKVNADSAQIDDTTHSRIHDSIQAAVDQYKADGIMPTQSMIYKTAAKVFDNYSKVRIENITSTETTRLYESSRSEVTDFLQSDIEDAINDEDYDTLDELEDYSDSYQMEDARQQLESGEEPSNIIDSVIGALNKTWISMRDDKVRDAHVEADGQSVGLDEMFDVMGEDLAYPGDSSHGASPENICNCRCFVMYGV